MRKIFTLLFLGAMVALFTEPIQSFAQTADTIYVNATPVGNVNNFIQGDTLTNGQRAHPNAVYKLYDDSLYYFTGAINANYNLTIVAPPASGNNTPPEIVPAILSDGSSPNHFINVTHGNVTLKRLYMSGVRPDEQLAGSICLNVSGDSDAVFRTDSCVFDGWWYQAVSGGGKRNSYFITNCIFQNNMSHTGWFLGQAMAQEGSTTSDTIWMVNNTLFCNNSYALVETYYNQYTRFEHNTVFLTAVNPFFLPQLINGDIKDNIFYGALAEGQRQIEIQGGWFDWDGLPSSTISFDTLSNVGADYHLTESDRHINVENNAYFWPSAITTFWTNVNDTASAANHLTPPNWMNSRTYTMFNDKTMWPHFNAAGNDSVDPGFPSSALSQIDTLLNYVYLTRTGGLGTYLWWYIPPSNIAAGENGPYPPVWPLTYSLAYSNTSLQSAGTDGLALGDLNWFPSQLSKFELTAVRTPTVQQVPSSYSLSQNYPNPFNPTTRIDYSLKEMGKVSIIVYDVLGEEVATLVNGVEAAGQHSVTFNASRFASGVYFYSMTMPDGLTMTKKMILMK